MLMPGGSCCAIPNTTGSDEHFTQSKDNENKEDLKNNEDTNYDSGENKETKKKRDENTGRHFELIYCTVLAVMNRNLPRPF